MCAEELESVKSRLLFSQKCIIEYTIYIFVAHTYKDIMSTHPLARTDIDLECLSTTHNR